MGASIDPLHPVVWLVCSVCSQQFSGKVAIIERVNA